MEVVSKIVRMRAVMDELRQRGRPVALVPTAGGLHEGQLSLVRQARERDAEVVVSIYPPSHDPGLTVDAESLVGEGVRVLFAPDENELFPEGHCTRVEVSGLTERRLGLKTRDELVQVTTLVTKLFHVIRPDLALFGWNDPQQLLVLRRLVRDLDLEVEIVGAPIVRDDEGVALSTHRDDLGEAGRKAASAIYRALQEARRLVEDGERSSRAVIDAITTRLGEEDDLDVAEVEVVGARDLTPIDRVEGLVLLVAAAVLEAEGREPLRLVDSLRVDVAQDS
ncbi:MAG: pantoate--beta-alanine ligase [Acidobacteriota bacterium]